MYREICKKTFPNSLNSTSKLQTEHRPITIIIEGFLVPCTKSIRWRRFSHKLQSSSDDYFLSMNESTRAFAKKIEWEEVIVEGLLNSNNGIIEVEKIIRSKINEPPRSLTSFRNSFFDLERFKQQSI